MEGYQVKKGKVKTFQKDKDYIFDKRSMDTKGQNKWIEYIKNPFVEIRLLGLGYIVIDHPTKGMLDYPVYPDWCSEIVFTGE